MPTREAFAGARAIVVPSRAESMPYVVLEAIAAGMPIIATRVGGIPEIFGPAADELVAPGDAAALARAIETFSPILRASPPPSPPGATGCVRASTSPAMHTEIEALYRRILDAQIRRGHGRALIRSRLVTTPAPIGGRRPHHPAVSGLATTPRGPASCVAGMTGIKPR